MNPYRYNISLRVRHTEIDPVQISAKLQLAPEWSWKAGDMRVDPAGAPLKGVWRESYWTRTVLSGEWPDKDFATALAELTMEFESHKPFFQKIRNEGGKVELFVGWFMSGNCGGELPPGLMGKLADLGITLSLDVYPPDVERDDSGAAAVIQ